MLNALFFLSRRCYYLKSKLWNEKKQELIEKLATHSAEVLSAIVCFVVVLALCCVHNSRSSHLSVICYG